ncbi:hypothetical protein GCM10009765_60390 [Fodinicola feengrottensis]|uniref:Uncharacterized protein n=1 Tax=Fodinicola feengrottensis TaxID=435914 RepID=A0ABN2IDD3_9ACTN
MTPHERRDEDLILDAELSQLRQLELTLDHDTTADQADPLDGKRSTAGQVCEFLPIHPSLCHI